MDLDTRDIGLVVGAAAALLTGVVFVLEGGATLATIGTVSIILSAILVIPLARDLLIAEGEAETG